MFGNPMEIAMIVGAAVLLFGADKLPKLARSLGNAKKEFVVGQAEADVAAERAKAEARAKIEAERPMSAAAEPGTGAAPTTPATPPTANSI
jgi:sec-independent protein translocase protein TatA